MVSIVSAAIDVKLDTGHRLNEIGMKHPFVCANFDWWPNEKCDYGQGFAIHSLKPDKTF